MLVFFFVIIERMNEQDKAIDVVIIGGGVAAFAGAIYSSRYGLNTMIIEQSLLGGQTATVDRIDNYPGLPGTSGFELAQNIEKQARDLGVKIKLATVNGLKKSGDDTVDIVTDKGTTRARAVLIATGARYRKLGIPGEDDYAHYCATCDGAFFRGKDIITIGGANTAVQEALYLCNIANSVTMLVRSHIKADQALKDQLHKQSNNNLSWTLGATPKEITKDDEGHIHVTYSLKDEPDAQATPEKIADGLFVFAGQEPNTDFVKEIIKLDDAGYIITDNKYHTSMERVWAAGDVRAGSTKQIITSMADAVQAIMDIRQTLQGDR